MINVVQGQCKGLNIATNDEDHYNGKSQDFAKGVTLDMFKIVVIPLVLLGLLIAYIQFEVPILVFWLNNVNDGLTANIAIGRLATLKQKPKLVAQLENKNSAARLFALRTLAQTQEAELWTYLPHLCNDHNTEVRDAAVIASGNLKVKGSVPAIVKYFDDGWANRTTRGMAMTRRAVIALIQIGHPTKRTVKIIAEHVGDDKYKGMIADELVPLANKKFIPVYINLVKSCANHERVIPVIKVLAKLQGPKCAHLLYNCVRSPVSAVRIRAVKTLAKFKDQEAIERIEKVYKKEKDKKVRAAMEAALKKIKG